MRAKQSQIWSLLAVLAIAFTFGCHAEPDDLAGQAGELTDPVRRANAIANISRLYSGALERANGDRSAAEPHGMADIAVPRLNDCYVANASVDIVNSENIITLLADMRDPRALPALTAALSWQPEVSEEPAIAAARTLRELTLDEAQKGQAITALAASLARVSGARGVDNRMRIEFIRTLGAFRDNRATAPLIEVLLRQTENQNFLINRLAAEQLGLIADPAAVPALVKALYLFAPGNANMRLNDVSEQALVRIGRPALQPLLDTLAGNNVEATQIATQLVTAIRALPGVDPAAVPTPAVIVKNEALHALGQLGFREALDPLLATVNQLDEGERADAIETDLGDEQLIVGAAISLVSINREDGDTQRMRDAITLAYNRLTPEIHPRRPNRPQLLVAMGHFHDAGLVPFLTARAIRAARAEDNDDNVRFYAFMSAMLLANATEAAPLQAIYTAEPEGDVRDGMGDYEPLFAVMTECNADLGCWTGKLADSNQMVVRKACYMVARYGRGNADAVTALVGQLGNQTAETRNEVLYALDFAATSGAPAAVARISELRDAEQGRSIWTQTESLALSVQARLGSRSGS